VDIEAYLLDRHGIRLSRQQREAVEAPPGEILLLAVPGAGKTTVLTARIAHLLLNLGEDPGRILTLTFNRESARDMARRWEELFGELIPKGPSFSTIHSFCYSLLREYAAGRGTHVPELLEGVGDGKERQRILVALYREETGDYLPDDLLRQVENALGYCVNMELSREEAASLDRELPGFSRLMERYTAWKRENRRMDFDDMLRFACTALERDHGLAGRVGERYRHILVDEVQDTSRLQHDIIRRVSRGNLFMVGDEDQSIYGFRGADPQRMTRFLEEHPAGRLMKLEENYRSTRAIVAGAARLIETNNQRHPKNIHTSREEGEPILVFQDLDLEEEYEAAADLLEKMPGGESCGVLYRTGFSGIGLGWVLRRRGIPFSSRETGLGYGSDFITRDVANFFRLAQDPGDLRAFRQLYFKLGCAISKEAAAAAMDAEPRDLLKYILDEVDYPSKNSGRLGWTRRVLAGMQGKSPLRQLDTVIRDLEYLTTLEKKSQESYQMNGYCQKLAILRDFSAHTPDVQAFLERLGEAEKVLNSPGKAQVTLSTVHSAKGREFDRVIILDALDGIFPGTDALEYRALGRDDLLEEETRLFYTAMTRAKNRLAVFAPARCMGRRLAASRFLHAVSGGIPMIGSVPLVPGLRVMHSFFGAGTVEEVDSARGRVAVRFKIGGIKQFTIECLKDGKIFQLL
jgi:DNA helicase-2/ATP-dependent DNA helicase PcrA